MWTLKIEIVDYIKIKNIYPPNDSFTKVKRRATWGRTTYSRTHTTSKGHVPRAHEEPPLEKTKKPAVPFPKRTYKRLTARDITRGTSARPQDTLANRITKTCTSFRVFPNKMEHCQALVRMRGNRNAHSLLVGMQISTAMLENC